MKAMLIPVGGQTKVIEIDGLESMQAAVGGHIEPCSWVFDDKPSIFVNDEGLYTCFPNRAVYATSADEGKQSWDGRTIHKGDLLTVLFGDMLATGFDPETGETVDISDEEIERVKERFGSPTSINSGCIEVMRIKMGLVNPMW